MKKSYHKSYIDSINKGLKHSVFYIKNKQIDADSLFSSINIYLKNISKKNNRIYFFGNGASSAFANHMALDFSKNGKILSRSLSDSSMLTALSNDYSYEDAMVEYLKLQNPSLR